MLGGSIGGENDKWELAFQQADLDSDGKVDLIEFKGVFKNMFEGQDDIKL